MTLLSLIFGLLIGTCIGFAWRYWSYRCLLAELTARNAMLQESSMMHLKLYGDACHEIYRLQDEQRQSGESWKLDGPNC